MSLEVNISLLNYEAGGLKTDGSYDFAPLVRAFLDDPNPDLILLCEAKFWHARGKRPFQAAMKDLSVLTGRPYVGELFTGPLGTAVIYDPSVLCLDATEEPDFADKRNLARFSLRADLRYQLQVFAEHWPYADGEQRLARAKLLARFGTGPVPTLIAGDMNATSSGPHLPDPDWANVPVSVRDHKGRQDLDGTWHADTRALDRLIGAWDTQTSRRINGAGFHHLAELDPLAPNPLPPTVNGEHLHIDYILANQALLATAEVVPGSYHVHIPPSANPANWPSDHRRVSCTLRNRGPSSSRPMSQTTRRDRGQQP
ncbi:MAG: endonuclease/exonuclease/phosphatase family protein [Micromonosporaceae bacterium]